MSRRTVVLILALAVPLSACVTAYQEDVAKRMPWPTPPPSALLARAEPNDDYPTVGGDILKGSSLEELDAARRASGDAMGPPPPRPAPVTPRAPLTP
jgi:CRISPR-associated Cas5-like protein